jgi:hypothetical protein
MVRVSVSCMGGSICRYRTRVMVRVRVTGGVALNSGLG